MELYNHLISEVEELIVGSSPRKWSYDPAKCWPDAGKNQLIMQREAAYELGGGAKEAVSFGCVTTDEKLVGADGVWLCGPDLAELRADSCYGRIVLFAVQDIGEEEEAYRAIQDIDFAKYHVFPTGFMMRALTEESREQVRVAKSAISAGISLGPVGFDYIRKYKENPAVRAVRVIFITDPAVDFTALRAIAKKSGEITMSLNTILKGLPTDCASCGFKELCDEVEGMRELHFRQAENKQ